MLQEFKTEIYPRRLWVATSWEEVKDKFTTYGEYEFKKSEDAYATTYPQILRKATGKHGVLIVFYASVLGSLVSLSYSINIKTLVAASWLRL